MTWRIAVVECQARADLPLADQRKKQCFRFPGLGPAGLEYIDNWSLWLDLKILWRTVPIVLAGTGAK